MINPNLIGAGVGAALGGYSQTGDDSYGTDVAGAAVGAAAGYYSAYDTMPRINLNNKQTSLKYSIDQTNSYDDLMNRTLRNLDKRLGEIEGLRTRASNCFSQGFAGIDHTLKANTLATTLNHNLSVGSGLGDPDYSIDTHYGKLTTGSERNAMTIRDMVASGKLTETQLSSIAQASSFKTRMAGPQNLEGIESTMKRMAPIQMDAGIRDQNKLDIITSHYQNKLGHSAEEAASKANILVKTLGNYNLSLGDYAITARGDGQSVTFPLTGHTPDGERYTYHGNTKVISKQFNPMAKLYIDKKSIGIHAIGHADVTRGMDPESLLKYQGSNDMASLKKMKSMMSKLTEYVGDDALSAGGKTSTLGMIKSNTIELGMALDVGDDGKYFFTKLSTVGKGDNVISDISKVIRDLGNDANYNPYERISGNAMTQIMSPEAAGNWHPAAFPTEEAGTSRVNLRAQTPLADGDFGESILKSEYFREMQRQGKKGVGDLLDSSVQGYRVDVSSDVGKMASLLYGSDVTLDDGYSLFNQKHAASLAAQESISTMIPNVGSEADPKFNTTLDFSAIKQAIDSGEGFKLDSNIYGYDKNGSPLQLGRQHSFAHIDSIKQTADGIQLSGKGIYMPEENDIVKAFATASKSGGMTVDERTFNKVALMGILESEGKLSLNEDGRKVSFLGKNMLLDDLDKHLDIGYDQYTKKYGLLDKAFQISRAEDTGLDDIQRILSGKYDNDDFVKKYGGIGHDNYVKEFVASQDKAERAGIARLMMSVTDTKANMDIWETAGEHLTNTGQLDRLAQLEKVKGSLGSSSAQLNMPVLKSILDEAYSGNQAFSHTSVTTNVGPAISGAGNVGSMSWLEQSKLMMDGLSKDDIRKLAKPNQQALMEVQMLMDSTKRGNIDPNKLNGINSLAGLLTKDVSVRRTALEKAGAKIAEGAQHATYNLSEEVLGMKSIPISFRDTGHAGVIDIDGEDVVKVLDKKRDALMSADIHLRNVAGSNEDYIRPIRDKFDAAAQDLSDTLQRMGGKLVKKATKLEAVGSKIQWAKPAGGEAQRYVNMMGGSADTAHFMSKKNALSFLTDAGLVEGTDFSIENVNKKGVPGISRILDKNGLPFMNQVSREPVQGPGSSIASELMIDDSMRGGKNAIHFAKMAGDNKQFLSVMAAMDFDGDAIRTLPIMNMSPEKLKGLANSNDRLINTLTDIKDVVRELSPKGSDKKAVSMVGMASGKFAEYNRAAAIKGRYRKPIAPLATKVSMDFQEAINNSGLSTERKVAARELAHSLTENMLKSKHRDTAKFLEKPNGVIEKLLAAQSTWMASEDLGKDTSFKNSLSGFLDESLGGKIMASGDDNLIGKYSQMKGDLIDSYVSTSGKKQVNSNWSIMDIAEHTYDKDRPGIASMAEAIDDVTLKGGGLGSLSDTIQSQDTIENLAHKSKSVYNDVKSGMVEFASKNKSKILPAALGLGAIAMLSDTRAPEQSASTQPTTKSKPKPLEPLKDRKAYTRKYKTDSDSYHAVASVKSSAENVQRHNLNRVLYGDMVTNAQINITDRSEMF